LIQSLFWLIGARTAASDDLKWRNEVRLQRFLVVNKERDDYKENLDMEPV